MERIEEIGKLLNPEADPLFGRGLDATGFSEIDRHSEVNQIDALVSIKSDTNLLAAVLD